MPRRSCWTLLMLLTMLWGCGRASSTAIKSANSVTYCGDVAPILLTHCASCHRPGEVAPFSLLTYDQARARHRQIAEVTHSRFMPPWLPEAGHCQFENERRLSDVEIDLLAKWAAAGTPQGDPRQLLPAPKFTSGWQLGAHRI